MKEIWGGGCGIIVFVIGNESQRPEIESWTKLLAFLIVLILLGKGMNPIILPQALIKITDLWTLLWQLV